MFEVFERLFISGDSACRSGNAELAVVHACKSPCHQRALEYKGNLSTDHPNYLVKEEPYDLYLNIIDPPVPLFKPLLFSSFLAFANGHWTSGTSMLIHCNQGESRAPSLALLFLAKSRSAINSESYEAAKVEFAELYPSYNPGKGIQAYLSTHWDELGEF